MPGRIIILVNIKLCINWLTKMNTDSAIIHIKQAEEALGRNDMLNVKTHYDAAAEILYKEYIKTRNTYEKNILAHSIVVCYWNSGNYEAISKINIPPGDFTMREIYTLAKDRCSPDYKVKIIRHFFELFEKHPSMALEVLYQHPYLFNNEDMNRYRISILKRIGKDKEALLFEEDLLKSI